MFGFPWLLWFGLLAVLVPLLHLIRFGQEIRRDWAAMSLLEVAVRKASRRAVPLQWSVVILRTVLMVCLVVLFASPGWDGLFPSFFRKPFHHVIVFDDSASTGEVVGQEKLIANLRQSVRRYVATRVAANDQVTLWRLSRLHQSAGVPDWDRLPSRELSENVVSVVDTFEPSDISARPDSVLTRLERNLGEVDTTISERFVWVGDFRLIDWNDLPRRKDLWARVNKRGLAVECLFSSRGRSDLGDVKNLAITSVSLQPGVACVESPLDFEVTVSNNSDQGAKDVSISIRVDGRIVPGGRIAMVPGRSSAQTKISLTFGTVGSHRIEFAVEPDLLACDNVYYKTVSVTKRLRVLLVTMDEELGEKEGANESDVSESQGLAKTIAAALNPGIDMGIIPLSENASAVDRRLLGRSDVVVLCGYRGGLRDFPAMLKDYVVRGGNIVFVPTIQSDYSAVNSELGVKGVGVLPLDLETPETVRDYGELHFEHWTTRVFTACGSLSETLQFSRVCPAKKTSTAAKEEYTVVAGWPDRPLMTIGTFGVGRVSQWFVSPLPEWSNWSSHLSYPVVWRDLIAWLCHPVEKENIAGEPSLFSLTRLDHGAVCRIDYFREDRKEPWGYIEFASGDGRFYAEMKDTVKAGYYALSSAETTADRTAVGNEEKCLRDELGRCLAVNVDRRESALDTAGDECLRELQRLGVTCRLDGVAGSYGEISSQGVADTFLFILIVILILWELGLSNLFYRSTRRRNA